MITRWGVLKAVSPQLYPVIKIYDSPCIAADRPVISKEKIL